VQWNGRVDAAAPDDAVQGPAVLWTPDPDEARESRIAGFARWVREHRDVGSDFPVDDFDYAGLHAWSVRDLDGIGCTLMDTVGIDVEMNFVASGNRNARGDRGIRKLRRAVIGVIYAGRRQCGQQKRR